MAVLRIVWVCLKGKKGWKWYLWKGKFGEEGGSRGEELGDVKVQDNMFDFDQSGSYKGRVWNNIVEVAIGLMSPNS